ncbi:hypothetical protein FHP25_27880 [Vineibacter terrae]|uniref:DUF2161 domain-containing phosphodiesterase n=1 Tax=Vineibacter terrae TaxID=2586908 RepID=A0A5C8PDI7_9HYPH|nr:DUF2161 family putative PD-(D/E)XK-type phosphodiesterase [Vineibacter terrae]TXL71866.1 hypothetical protein FHP25_27880 [Vineibacter terrae]
MTAETDLYAPVKAFLEGQGYVVKGEIRQCDIVAVRGAEPPVVVELKRAFNLSLVLQGVDRLSLSDTVYLAIGAWPKRLRDIKRLCRRLGLGLMLVSGPRVDVLLDPLPYQPRKNTRRVQRLLGEHARRVGDPNRGGATTRQPVMTAYRQQALRCAALLATHGPMTPAQLRAADDLPSAGRILLQDAYGWFEHVGRALYGLTPEGRRGLERFGWAVSFPPPTLVGEVPDGRRGRQPGLRN